MTAIDDIQGERARIASLGHTADLPDGTGMWRQVADAEEVRDECDEATKRGTVTFRHLPAEEAAEAFAESGPAKLRAELVQVAAVCVRWIETIDARCTKETT